VAGVRAVDDAPVHVVTEAPLAAAVSRVDEERFSAAALSRSLEDLAWLEAVARAHDDVVSHLAGLRPVAPVRLATVFVGEGNLRALLRARAEEFGTALDRIRGRVEWAVKVFAVDGQAGPSSAAAAADASPGRAYLERRRAERDDAERRHDRVLEEADAVHERLTRLAVASRRYPPQDPRLTGFWDEMVLNAAYLLPEGGEAELRRVTQEPPGTVIRMELTGPWAPYSFATLEEP
jgi:hypothetical protein